MTATATDPSRWNLKPIYDDLNDPRIRADQDAARADAEVFAATYRGRIATLEPQAFRTMIQNLERIRLLAHRPVWYANLRFAAQTDDLAVKVLVDAVRARAVEIGNLLTFAQLELTNLPEEAAAQLLNPEAGLADYAHAISSERRFSRHTLSEVEERLVSTKSLTGRAAWTQLYTEISSAIRIPFTLDGQTRDLTVDEVRALRSRPEREVRQRAVERLFGAFAEREHVLTYIFNVLYQDWKLETSLRHYDSPIAPTILRDELPEASINALMETTFKNADLVQDYYAVKAKTLSIDGFSSFDALAPYRQETTHYRFEQARELVLEAVQAFSPELGALCQAFFAEHRIDVMPRPGKRGGAFCSSFSPHDPAFILLNFNGRLDDVFTLAHELGHGVHAECSRQQNPTNFGHSLPLAETASVFLEMVLLDHLMRQADASTRRDLIANLIEDAITTIYRQVQITRWEQLAHRERAGGVVSSQRYGELWMDTYHAIYGDAVKPTPHDRWGWIGIPHVVGSRFYCYSYAFGNLLVYALFEQYQREGQSFVPKYLEFLSSGQSAAPDALVSRLGVDVTDPGFWQSGFDFLKRQFETFKSLT